MAIYDQIVRPMKFAIAERTLRPGQLIPSVRVLCQHLTINPNTINRAFQQLQADGVLESLRGRGLTVHSLPGLQHCVTEDEMSIAILSALPMWHPPTIPSLLHELRWGAR